MAGKEKNGKGKGMIEFGWLFALIIGAIILLLALIFSRQLIQTETMKEEAALAAGLDILLNPFSSIGGTTITLAKNITLPSKTILNWSCDLNYSIGRNKLIVTSESAFGKGLGSPEKVIYNKYIFSPASTTAKQIFVLGKSLELPFRVDDAIYILDRPYCFVNAPSEIKEELEDVAVPVKFVSAQGSCAPEEKKVCFGQLGQLGCDINVASTDGYESGAVTKEKSVNFATRTLLYAAIFSDPEIYDCNVQRLLRRLTNVTDIYLYKADQLLARGCETQNIEVIEAELVALRTAAASASNINQVAEQAKVIAEKNRLLDCHVF
jgi:hypothetical protein